MGNDAAQPAENILTFLWEGFLTEWMLLLCSRYTGSYNYGSYSNQHPHSIQSQYPSLAHEPAISTPLHYSAYHRSSAQVSLNHSTTLGELKPEPLIHLEVKAS